MSDSLFYALPYNSSLVLGSFIIFGFVSGWAGSFVLLQKRSLVSDALSHAMLPGVAIGFLFATLVFAISGPAVLPFLLLGAVITSALALLCLRGMKSTGLITEDASIACVLVFFYACGLLILSVIQRLDGPSPAGLSGIMLGQIAGLSAQESLIIIFISFAIFILSLLLYRDLRLFAFDREYALAINRPVERHDLIFMMCLLLFVASGIKTAGLILVLSLLIIPAATARLLTNNLSSMLWLSGCIGAFSSLFGGLISSAVENTPTGPAIILTAASLFLLCFAGSHLQKKVMP